ncbi:MAG TPA: hypothetical protein VFX65_15110 [Candidatus Limnocylindrales bacterium]|nr:hypothetical protein [Candidatus Limnocylindrales bacterium]
MEHGHGGEAVGDVEPRDRGRVGDRGEVDRRVPGEQEPDVAVDGGPCGRCERQPQAAEGALELAIVGLGKCGQGVDVRRERISLAVQACLLER